MSLHLSSKIKLSLAILAVLIAAYISTNYLVDQNLKKVYQQIQSQIGLSNTEQTSQNSNSDNVETEPNNESNNKSNDLPPDDKLILNPQDQSEFFVGKQKLIPLEASVEVTWEINGKSYGGVNYFLPVVAGTYGIKAIGKDSEETIEIHVIEE